MTFLKKDFGEKIEETSDLKKITPPKNIIFELFSSFKNVIFFHHDIKKIDEKIEETSDLKKSPLQKTLFFSFSAHFFSS